MSPQAPGSVVLVRPHHFAPNPQTNTDNSFHSWDVAPLFRRDISQSAFNASTRLARALETAGVDVHVFEDTETHRPDSVFPNNWFSTHAGGRMALYPMFAENRRTERRTDIVDFIKRHYQVGEVIDFSGLEEDGMYLEGTGTMVLDHVARVAYTAKSRRAHPLALERFCARFDYEPVFFSAQDSDGRAIYHTNILMSIATEFALVGFDSIRVKSQRRRIESKLADSGREAVALSQSQLREFAGNAIELTSRHGHRVLALSARAARSLTPWQRGVIEDSCQILPVDVGPIEMAGGSVRCMIAGIHLQRRLGAAQPEPRADEFEAFPQAV